MCSRDCYRVCGYFLGFLWMFSAVYYTSETVELLRLMKLQCGTPGTPGSPESPESPGSPETPASPGTPETPETQETPGSSPPARLHFDDELTQKACEFYTHLDVFMPYHLVTTIIKMTPGFLLVLGIYRNNPTLVVVFATFALLEEVFFVVVFSKIFAVIDVSDKSVWIYWIVVMFCVKVVVTIWIVLGVYAAVRPSPTGAVRVRVRAHPV